MERDIDITTHKALGRCKIFVVINGRYVTKKRLGYNGHIKTGALGIEKVKNKAL
jgi:hypothetical protein